MNRSVSYKSRWCWSKRRPHRRRDRSGMHLDPTSCDYSWPAKIRCRNTSVHEATRGLCLSQTGWWWNNRTIYHNIIIIIIIIIIVVTGEWSATHRLVSWTLLAKTGLADVDPEPWLVQYPYVTGQPSWHQPRVPLISSFLHLQGNRI